MIVSTPGVFNLGNLLFLSKNFEEIPQIIKPQLKSYTLEILYWGLRNLKGNDFITLGLQSKLSLDVEIGALKPFEPNFLEKCSINENFAITHRKSKLDLPECDEYKPHLNIKCECYGSFYLYNSPINADLDLIKKVFER
jgi:hypothetical protein